MQQYVYIHTYIYSLTCDGKIARAVGLSSVILSKAVVDTLIIFGGIEDLQTPIKQDRNSKNEPKLINPSCSTVAR